MMNDDHEPAATPVTAMPPLEVMAQSAWTRTTTGCPQCDYNHPPELPHNLQSLHYLYAFRNTETAAGRPARWPTWADAMAHCSDDFKECWIQALEQHGISI